jgi:hypothetical protein
LTRFPVANVSQGSRIHGFNPPISIADVERLLEEKSYLEQLIDQRGQLRKQIDDLDRRIQAALSLERPRHLGRPRLSNVAPLRTVVLEVLKKNNRGLVLSELTAKAIVAGYKNQLGNFENVICLSRARNRARR